MSGQPAALALVCLTLCLCPRALTAQEQPAPPAAAQSAAGQPLRVGGNVQRPEKISGSPPVYTELARKARLQGTVIVESIIDEQGDVTDVRVLKGLPMGLDLAAVEAVKTWKFNPATLDGIPVKVYYTLTVNFQVDSSPYRGPAFFKFLAANRDFTKALDDEQYAEAARLLDRASDPESALARVYLLLEQDLLDDAWREALRYDGANRSEILLAVAAFALHSALPTTKDAAARARAVDLGLEAATSAIELEADSLDAIGYKMMLLREKARQTTDPAERQRLIDEAAQLEQRRLEIRGAAAAAH